MYMRENVCVCECVCMSTHSHMCIPVKDEQGKDCLHFLNSYRPCTGGRGAEFQAGMVTEPDCVHFYDTLVDMQQQLQVEIKTHSALHMLCLFDD